MSSVFSKIFSLKFVENAKIVHFDLVTNPIVILEKIYLTFPNILLINN
jgi:hypothetical protein